MNIHFLQHVDYEGPGAILDWTTQNGFSHSITKLYQNENLPSIDGVNALVIMGGPMSVWEEDENPFLRGEKEWIHTCIVAGIPVLGICLGAQLLSEVLGGKVTPHHQREIGWYPIYTNESLTAKDTPAWAKKIDKQMKVFHWHGDTFSVPPNAIHLFASAACENQGFIAHNGQVLGLQFHWEMKPQGVEALLAAGHQVRPNEKHVQNAHDIHAGITNTAVCHEQLFKCLDAWLHPMLA